MIGSSLHIEDATEQQTKTNPFCCTCIMQPEQFLLLHDETFFFTETVEIVPMDDASGGCALLDCKEKCLMDENGLPYCRYVCP